MFEKQVQTWCKEAGEGVSYEFIQVNTVVEINSFFVLLHATCFCFRIVLIAYIHDKNRFHQLWFV